jgi:hypothetical protein
MIKFLINSCHHNKKKKMNQFRESYVVFWSQQFVGRVNFNILPINLGLGQIIPEKRPSGKRVGQSIKGSDNNFS